MEIFVLYTTAVGLVKSIENKTQSAVRLDLVSPVKEQPVYRAPMAAAFQLL
jgi:hypothetical protein